MTTPLIEPPTDPRGRLGFARIVGRVLVVVGLVGLVWEMNDGAPIHQVHLWIYIGMGMVGMYFETPKRTSELVALVGAYIPLRGGGRPADKLAPPSAPPVEVVRTEVPVTAPAAGTPDETPERYGDESDGEAMR